MQRKPKYELDNPGPYKLHLCFTRAQCWDKSTDFLSGPIVAQLICTMITVYFDNCH